MLSSENVAGLEAECFRSRFRFPPLRPRLRRGSVSNLPCTDSVTISRAFARKGKLKIFVRAQKILSRAILELWYFWSFLGFKYSYVVKIGKIWKKY